MDKYGSPLPKIQEDIKRFIPKDELVYPLYKDFHNNFDDFIMGRVHKLLPE